MIRFLPMDDMRRSSPASKGRVSAALAVCHAKRQGQSQDRNVQGWAGLVWGGSVDLPRKMALRVCPSRPTRFETLCPGGPEDMVAAGAKRM